MTEDLLDRPATAEALEALAAGGALPRAVLGRAREIAAATPPAEEWKRFLSTLLLVLGVLLVLAGAIFFFAYNWDRLGRFGKLGLLAAAIAASAAGGWRLGLDRPAGRAGLAAACVLVGALLAVFGQAYQTGADPYSLFLAWALLIVPWVAASRFAPLWILPLALLQVALALWWEQVLGPRTEVEEMSLYLLLSGANAAALVAWELFAARGVPWLARRWGPQLLAAAALACLVIADGGFIVRGEGGRVAVAAAVLSVGGGAALAWRYHFVRPDLVILALGLVGACILADVAIGRWILEGPEAGAFLLMGMIILGEVSAISWWLLGQYRARRREAAR